MIRLPLFESAPVPGSAADVSPSQVNAGPSGHMVSDLGFGDAVAPGGGADLAAPPLQRSDLVPYAVRMVMPMRREFGLSMDVTCFLSDLGYTSEILERAKTSRDARLRAYAAFLGLRLLGQALPEQLRFTS
jgi:hypothetical protein